MAKTSDKLSQLGLQFDILATTLNHVNHLASKPIKFWAQKLNQSTINGGFEGLRSHNKGMILESTINRKKDSTQ